jgi:hypothetical protein
MSKRPHRLAGSSKALGRTNKPRPSSKRLASVSHETLRRAAPAENVRMGFSPKARRYVKADVRKITKATASISARQAETKRVSKRYGFETLEAATQARREGALGYESQDQAERVARAADTRLRKQAQRSVGETLSAPRPYRKKASRFVLTNARRINYERNRERKLRGEWIDGPEWLEMMDTANALKDHRVLQLRASPVVSGYGIGK